MSGKRTDYITKDDAYMLIAHVISMRSKDPNTQVGCVIVSKEDRILSLGYNGFPNGCSDDEFPWEREAECEEDTKFMFVTHSEANAILNFRGDTKTLEGSTLYVTLFPCNECAKLIIQCGIKKVVYKSNKYKDTASCKAAKRMFDAVGIECVEYHMDHDEQTITTKQLMNYFDM